MRALITNDDGITSPGLQELARRVESIGFEVVVVAPSFDASGTGASLGYISRDVPIKYQSHTIENFKGQAFALNGPPALCTISGFLGAFGPKPDIVISGPNLGLNTGRSVLHSGTVGAALAAQNFGIRSLAVSLAVSDPWHWDTACRFSIDLLEPLMGASNRCMLNLNVPALPYHEVKSMRWASLAEFGSVRSQIVDEGDGELFFDLVETAYSPPANSDLGLVNAGFAAVTALNCSAEIWNTQTSAGNEVVAEHALPSADTGGKLEAPEAIRFAQSE
jgi:5'-nucleotidase